MIISTSRKLPEPLELSQLLNKEFPDKYTHVFQGIDEKESGLRRILNFGHTLGHAIEAASHYRGIKHGEAVGHGMIAATRIAQQLRRISGNEASRIVTAIQSIGALPSIADLPVKEMMKSMRHDKKIRDGSIHFVLPRRVGTVDVEAGISPKLVATVIRSLSQ